MHYILRIPAAGGAETLELSGTQIPPEKAAALLDTDVTERMRIPVMPEGMEPDCVLCYLIDARGGDKSLPANFIGTCFYHTGCPVYGDLLIVKCREQSGDAEIFGLTEDETALLRGWLAAQFPAYSI